MSNIHTPSSHNHNPQATRGRQTRHPSSLSQQQYPSSQRYFDQYSPGRQKSSQPRPSFLAPQSSGILSLDQPPEYDIAVSQANNPNYIPADRFNQQQDTEPLPSSPSPPPPPPPPPHRSPLPQQSRADDNPAARARSLGYTNSVRTASTTTPGVDNLGDAAAGGGIAGIAYGVAQANERESGVRALQAMQEAQRRIGTRPDSMNTNREDNPYVPEPRAGYHSRSLAPGTPDSRPTDPFGSQASLSSMPKDAFAGGLGPPGRMAGRPPSGTWVDTPYQRRSQLWDANVDSFNPNEIDDDGVDDALHGPAHTGRKSVYQGISNRPHSSMASRPVVAGAAAGAGAGIGATVAELAGRNTSGKYGPVGQHTEYIGGHDDEKDWDNVQDSKRKKRLWMSIGIAALIIAIIIGAVIGGVYGSRAHANPGSNSNNNAAYNDPDDGTDLTADSATIKALMNNDQLHRVFPGIAYTPLNAQYPECLSNMPIQNNVTKDLAILSQLTDTIRLYGTDCNQTEMVIEALNRLKITDMKIWPAVWLNNNATTNTRGMNTMHDLIKTYGDKYFKGVIIGNEVLYRKDLTTTEVLDFVSQARGNISEAKVNLPIAIADLGDNWTADMVQYVDVVMSNVHPFFGGVPVAQAAGWAWNFWTEKDVALTTSNTTKQNIISEIGWPSGGGNDCGVDGNCTSTTDGAVASVENMNMFMEDFVCQSISNKTDYFWFEAFDEPWKAIFNTDDEKWETQWGLFDSNRKFKDGLKIPDCGGQKPSY